MVLMRIVHTSDWHLGRSFGPVSLHDDQVAFCHEFVRIVEEHDADLVVIAGDIYDRAVAPTESIELLRETLRWLRKLDLVVAIISGNHDGADRLSPYDDLLDGSGVYVRGGYEGVGRVIPLEFDDGPLDLVLLPFLNPMSAPDDDPGHTAEKKIERSVRRTHQQVLADAIEQARSELRAPRSVAVAHAFVTGGDRPEDQPKESTSERVLEVGGQGAVNAAVFDGFSYTALGHLHRPQNVGSDIIRYCGTPLPYSFSEDHQKSVSIIDMDAGGAVEISTADLNVGRRVYSMIGTMDELLDPANHPDAVECFVRATVTDPGLVLDAKSRLEATYPLTIEVHLQPAGGTATTAAE
ncbi:MAG TPA: exonuclease SbcCD subunit D, partial [Acidimicrobiaceae bacterium]|nr:exonuclease SbcCD subunit D [Acidimicrobiaceae bacterium]